MGNNFSVLCAAFACQPFKNYANEHNEHNENNCLRISICIKRFRGDIGRASDF